MIVLQDLASWVFQQHFEIRVVMLHSAASVDRHEYVVDMNEAALGGATERGWASAAEQTDLAVRKAADAAHIAEPWAAELAAKQGAGGLGVQIVELAAVEQEGCFGLDQAMATKPPVAGLEL